MGADRSATKKNVALLSLSLCAVLLPAALYYLRYLDDDRLTSWEWVFQGVPAMKTFLALTGGVIIAFLLSRVPKFPVRPSLFLFCLSFVSSALLWREPEVIVDVSRYFTAAKHLELYGIRYFIREWGGQIGAWTDMPLFPFLYGLIFRIFGESRIYIQIFTTLLFSLSTLLTYLIGRELWNEETGFYGGLLLLGMPYLLTQVPLMLVDLPTMCLLLCAVYGFLAALRRGGLMIPVAAVALFLSFYSKYSAWLMLSVLVVIFCVTAAQGGSTGGGRSVRRRAFVTACIGGFLIGIVFVCKAEVFLAQMRLLWEYQKPGLGRWGESFLSTFFFQIHPFISLAAISSVIVAIRRRDLKYVIIAWLVLLVLVLRIRRIRYLIVVFPMVSLMAAYSIAVIRDREIKSFIVSCILVVSLGISHFFYLPFLEKISTVNLKNAGQFLDNALAQNVEVFSIESGEAVAGPSVAVTILDLFTDKGIIYCPEPGSRPPADIHTSPLRFTWEFTPPGYYCRPQDEGADVVAIISGGDDMDLPEKIRRRLEGFHVEKVFDTYEGVFSYRTAVSIYERDAGEHGTVKTGVVSRVSARATVR